MRKLTAILLLSIFAFSQYAWQLSYLECKLSNSFKPSSLTCDCEKQAGFDKLGTDPSAASKTHLHVHLDELFAAPKNEILILDFSAQRSPHCLYADDECEGNHSTPWQPPNS